MNQPDDNSPTPAVISEADFMRLFVRHEPILRCVARGMLSDWSRVDDCLQEAGITMWQKIDQLENEDGFLPWARVIVRFKCHSAINAARRDRLVLSDEAIRLISADLDDIDREFYESSLAALRKCLEKLPSHQRDLVLTPYRRKELVEDIAGRTGKTVNALYKQLGRLRSRLSVCVQQTLQAES